MKKINYNEEDLEDHHAVAAIIKNNKNEILMQDHIKYGFWTIPIGKAKNNESPMSGIKNEVFEECNLKIIDPKEIILNDSMDIRNGEKVRVILHIYEIKNYSGNLMNKESEKHKEIKFISLEKIKKLSYLSNATIIYLKYLGINRKTRI